MKQALPRVLPFVVFMAFIGLDELLRSLIEHGFIQFDATAIYYLYPLKTVVVGYLLYRFRKEYNELDFKDLRSHATTLVVSCVGVLVFLLWIRMDWTLSASATPAGFNPTLLPDVAVRIIMIFFRIIGAVLVVPLMEELFWRSFLIRYIIDTDFEKVKIGTFTWCSFLLTIALFGSEHYYIYAGIMAGVAYNLILYKTRSLAQCVLAHAVTNLALSIYVVFTGKWQFW
ncbi:MAG: CAAX prenyl protease-related protein [Desulfuromonadaceae bacterium]